MYPPPMTIAACPNAAIIDFVWNMRDCRNPKSADELARKPGGFRSVRRLFSADKYEPSSYVCQACKHHILCLSFRSLARCGRLTLGLSSVRSGGLQAEARDIRGFVRAKAGLPSRSSPLRGSRAKAGGRPTCGL